MIKLLQLKPGKYLLLHFEIMILSVLTFIVWTKLVPETLISFGFTFLVIGFVGGYLFWIYVILNGFKNIDLKNGVENDLNKSKILLLCILISYVVIVLIFMLDFVELNDDIPFFISILIAPLLTYAFFEIVIKLTRKFKDYDKKTKPNLWDYFITIFSLSFYPFGLLMMHSHLRLILKDQKIIET